jgi:UDP-N-acetylglucosamine:LPS N-acetylglucosamine transferase
VGGLSTDFGPSLAWRYQFWDEIALFLSPVPSSALGFPLPGSCGFHHVRIPARSRFESLANVPGHPREVMVCGGFWGLGGLDDVARRLARGVADVTIHVVCGDDERLRQEVSAAFAGTPRVVAHGALDDLSPVMARCASVVTKPGTASLVEAHAAQRKLFLLEGLPVAERYNAAYAMAHFDAERFSPKGFRRGLESRESPVRQRGPGP